MCRVIGAKQFAIELLAQESTCRKAQQLMSSDVFLRNACLIGSAGARHEGVSVDASSSREIGESRT